MRWARRYRVWLGVATAAAGLAAWLRCGALPPGMLDLDAQVSTQVVARDGEPLRESLSADGQRSRLILAGRLPDALLRATLAAEDARFFRAWTRWPSRARSSTTSPPAVSWKAARRSPSRS